MGSVVTAEVAEMENNTREIITRRMRKEVVGCFQDVVRKKKLLFQFEDGQNK